MFGSQFQIVQKKVSDILSISGILLAIYSISVVGVAFGFVIGTILKYDGILNMATPVIFIEIFVPVNNTINLLCFVLGILRGIYKKFKKESDI